MIAQWRPRWLTAAQREEWRLMAAAHFPGLWSGRVSQSELARQFGDRSSRGGTVLLRGAIRTNTATSAFCSHTKQDEPASIVQW